MDVPLIGPHFYRVPIPCLSRPWLLESRRTVYPEFGVGFINVRRLRITEPRPMYLSALKSRYHHPHIYEPIYFKLCSKPIIQV